VLSVEAAELAGVETERSRLGTASRASEGDTLGEGEEGRCTGELSVLAGGLACSSAISSKLQMFQMRRMWCTLAVAARFQHWETLVVCTTAEDVSGCKHSPDAVKTQVSSDNHSQIGATRATDSPLLQPNCGAP